MVLKELLTHNSLLLSLSVSSASLLALRVAAATIAVDVNVSVIVVIVTCFQLLSVMTSVTSMKSRQMGFACGVILA